LGHYKSSLTDALKSIEINPQFIKGYFRAAQSLMNINILDKSLEYLEKCEENSENEKLNLKGCKALKELIIYKQKEHEYNKTSKF